MSKKPQPLPGDIIFRYTIHGDPPSKKNSMRKTRRGLIPNKKYCNWRNEAEAQIREAGLRPVKCNPPFNIAFLIFRKNRRGGPGDVNNYTHAPQDILVTEGIIPEDNRDIVYSIDGSRIFFDKEDPRIEIIITVTKEGL